MKHQSTIIVLILMLLSCTKESIDLKDSLHTDVGSASIKNSKKALPKRIWHAYGSYAETWDFFYNKKGRVDSIDLLVESYYYGQWRIGYKVFYSGDRIDSVTSTRWGYTWDLLKNIKYENGLLVEGDIYFAVIFNNPPRKFRIEYDKKKRPLNSPTGEKFFYGESGELVSYIHPVLYNGTASFTSDNTENPVHRIPDLNIILMSSQELSFTWYNPYNMTSISYGNGNKTTVENKFDYFGNLISRSYEIGLISGPNQWNYIY